MSFVRAAVLVCFLACGAPEHELHARCDRMDVGRCTDAESDSDRFVTQFENECSMSGGTPSRTEVCPSEGRTGDCPSIMLGYGAGPGGVITQRLYAPRFSTQAQVDAACGT